MLKATAFAIGLALIVTLSSAPLAHATPSIPIPPPVSGSHGEVVSR